MQEALTYTGVSAVARYSDRSEIVERPGLSGGNASIYETKDGGYVQLAIFMTGHWRKLTRDWMDDPVLSGDDWDSSQYRTDNEDLAQILIQDFIKQCHTTNKIIYPTTDPFCSNLNYFKNYD